MAFFSTPVSSHRTRSVIVTSFPLVLAAMVFSTAMAASVSSDARYTSEDSSPMTCKCNFTAPGKVSLRPGQTVHILCNLSVLLNGGVYLRQIKSSKLENPRLLLVDARHFAFDISYEQGHLDKSESSDWEIVGRQGQARFSGVVRFSATRSIADCPPVNNTTTRAPGLKITTPVALGKHHASKGAVVRYQCKEGHFMIGNAERQCLSNGKWSNIEPICIESDWVRIKVKGMSDIVDSNQLHPVRIPSSGVRGPTTNIICTTRSYSETSKIEFDEKDGNAEVQKPLDSLDGASRLKQVVLILKEDEGKVSTVVCKGQQTIRLSDGTKIRMKKTITVEVEHANV